MKHIFYILTIVILTGCGTNSQKQVGQESISTAPVIVKTEEINQLQQEIDKLSEIDYRKESIEEEFENSILYSLTDTIEADFNGDGNVDNAVFVKKDGTSGIIIKHGLTNTEVRIGFGNQFAHLTQFNWVDFWGVVKDTSSFEIIIDESSEVMFRDTLIMLENPSIFVRKDEVGGGLITFKNGTYQWVHQSD